MKLLKIIVYLSSKQKYRIENFLIPGEKAFCKLHKEINKQYI